jgi:hypothetical protein
MEERRPSDTFVTGLFSLLLAIAGFWVLNDTPAKITKWLTTEEKRFLILRNRYAAGGETGIAEKEEFSWKAAREAFTVCPKCHAFVRSSSS